MLGVKSCCPVLLREVSTRPRGSGDLMQRDEAAAEASPAAVLMLLFLIKSSLTMQRENFYLFYYGGYEDIFLK